MELLDVKFMDGIERNCIAEYSLLSDDEVKKYSGYYLGIISISVDSEEDFTLETIKLSVDGKEYDYMLENGVTVKFDNNYEFEDISIYMQLVRFSTNDMREGTHGFSFPISLGVNKDVLIKDVSVSDFLRVEEFYFDDGTRSLVTHRDGGYFINGDTNVELHVVMYLADEKYMYHDIQTNVVITYEIEGEEFKKYIKVYSSESGYPDSYKQIVKLILED